MTPSRRRGDRDHSFIAGLLHRPSRPAPVVMWLAMAALLVVLFHQQTGKIDKNTARTLAAQAQSRSARALGVAIQHERRRNIFASCAGQNERYAAAVRTYDRLYSEIKRTGTAKQIVQAEQGRKATILFINALVPRRNCEQLVASQVDVPRP